MHRYDSRNANVPDIENPLKPIDHPIESSLEFGCKCELECNRLIFSNHALHEPPPRQFLTYGLTCRDRTECMPIIMTMQLLVSFVVE